ncbi:hypothetical protein Tco_0112151 [Tanacetum coccineum]
MDQIHITYVLVQPAGQLDNQPAGSCRDEGKTQAIRAAEKPSWAAGSLNGAEDILDDGDSLEARKLTVGKNKEELELFKALDHKVFSLPCDVDGQGAWDAELDMADSFNYMMEERFDQLVIGYANEDEPSVIFGRDFLVTSKNRVDFGIGEMRIDLTMLEEMKDIDVMLDELVENLEEVEIPPIFAIAPPSPIYHPLTQKQKEKVKEALDRKYKELEESKPILEVLENYMTYQKKLDEVLMGKARLSNDDYSEKVKMRIVEHGLPKKMCDLGNFVLLVKLNGTIEMNALVDTGASVSVLPYCLFMNLGLGDPKPYNSNLTMADVSLKILSRTGSSFITCTSLGHLIS